MKALKFKMIIFALGAISLSSCTKLLFTSLDVLRPAKISINGNANNALFVNNSIIQPSNYGHTTQLVNEKSNQEIVDTDSLSIFALGSLYENIEGKDFFNSVKLLPVSTNTNKDFNNINFLDNEKVKELCNIYNADVIISLNRIKVNDKITEMLDFETLSYLTLFDVIFESSWSIHYPDKLEFSTLQTKDTIFWEANNYLRNKGINELPKRSDALIDGALHVGQKTVNRLIPYWEKVDRYFFNPNKKHFVQAMDSVLVKNWKAAISNWNIALNKSKSKWLKAQAANNIAIAYEIDGNIEKAIEFASHSYYYIEDLNIVDYNSMARIAEYRKELLQRRKEIKLLKSQLGE